MKVPTLLGRLRSRLALTTASERGQALVETVMSVGFLVAIAIVINRMLPPVVVEAFEKISRALASIGP